jgi:lycopene beta-cyclase
MPDSTDVLIVGAGPAGWALAGQCAAHGLSTAIVDPSPHRRWRPTYAAWADHLPPMSPAAIAAAPHDVVVFGTRRHTVTGQYLIFDNDGLRDQLADSRVAVHTGRAVSIAQHGPVRLADGRTLAAHLVVDASGAVHSPATAEQTGAGIMLSTAEAAPLLDGADAVLMDWRPPDRVDQPDPTFLYAVPVGRDRVLVEETSLARRPGLPIAVLRSRLSARLARAGIGRNAHSPLAETVRIPLDPPIPHRVVSFGARAGMTHPATGYGIADALRMAPVVAARIAEAISRGPRGPRDARIAAHRALWPARARAVRLLRRRGLAALLALPPDGPDNIAGFFDLFFTLPDQLRRTYLNDSQNLGGHAMAMITLFRQAPWRLRTTLAIPTR